MAGHSHWAGIKHKKAVIDNKRGKLWSKLSKAIIVAAKLGGGDPDGNVRLRTAIAEAKSLSLPKDNIMRAIKKGTGELEGGNIEEVIYEGYGPSGVAIMCDAMTDNRNRTAPELRNIFTKYNGKLGATNCVAYLFERKGLFLIHKNNVTEEALMEIAMEYGGDDVSHAGDNLELTCEAESYSAISNALDKADIDVNSRSITRIPTNTVDLNLSEARKVFRLLEALDDNDDVQNVSANFNVSDEVMAELESGD